MCNIQDLITAAELSRRLGVSVGTINQWASGSGHANGSKLPYHEIAGGRKLFNELEVNQWIDKTEDVKLFLNLKAQGLHCNIKAYRRTEEARKKRLEEEAINKVAFTFSEFIAATKQFDWIDSDSLSKFILTHIKDNIVI